MGVPLALPSVPVCQGGAVHEGNCRLKGRWKKTDGIAALSRGLFSRPFDLDFKGGGMRGAPSPVG